MPPASLVLLFHAVGTPHDSGYNDTVSAEDLDRALAWLQAHYRVVSLDELARRQVAEQPLAGLAALSFDDNHRSIAEIALPLAVARGLPATWFLMTAPLSGTAYWRRQITRIIAQGQEAAFRTFLAIEAPALVQRVRPSKLYKDSKDPTRVSPLEMIRLLQAYDPQPGPDDDFVTPGEVAALTLPGVTLGNHSHRHLVMSGLSAEEQQREITTAAEALSHFPQRKSGLFCVPFGGPNSYDADTLEAAAAAGLSGIAVTAAGLTAADDVSAHPLLSRRGQPALVRSLSPALRGIAI